MESVTDYATFKKKKWVTSNDQNLNSSKKQLGRILTPSQIEKRNALASILDIPKLFDYLNSNDEEALLIGLSTFRFKIVEESKMVVPTILLNPKGQYGEVLDEYGEEENLAPSWKDSRLSKENIIFPASLPNQKLILQLYLEGSPQTPELIHLIDKILVKKNNDSNLTIVLLDLLTAVLSRNTWTNLVFSTHQLARKITKSCYHTFAKNFSSTNNLIVISTLRLCKAIVNTSPIHARDLMNSVDLTNKVLF